MAWPAGRCNTISVRFGPFESAIYETRSCNEFRNESLTNQIIKKHMILVIIIYKLYLKAGR